MAVTVHSIGAGDVTGRATVYESTLSGERFELDLPLECAREIGGLRDELGLPRYIDVGDENVARAIGILWAARHAPELAAAHESLRTLARPLVVAVFGGVAVRFLCPSANAEGPFRRPLGDVDLVVARRDGRDLVTLLSGLEDALGNRFWHAVTKSDQMFNALRRGSRYRIHGVEEHDGGDVRGCILDIVTGQIGFCHTIHVDEMLADSTQRRHTVGAAALLLTKLQAIQALPPGQVPAEHRYRVTGEIGTDLLLGPEDKDVVDAAALLVDWGIGTDTTQIDPEVLGGAFARDWGLAKTVRLNASNRGMFEHVLRTRGADDETLGRTRRGLKDLLEIIDDPRFDSRKPRFRLSKTWWEVVEDHEHD